MIPSAIIADSRSLTNTWTDVVTAAQAYVHLNKVINKFWNRIIRQRPWYGITTWTFDTTATSSYTLTAPDAQATLVGSTFGIWKIEKIWIKYLSDQTNYTPVKLIYIDTILRLPEYYATAASAADPIALIFDTSISIYPTPVAVTNGLQIVWHKRHFPLSSSTEDVEGCILIPSDWHYVLVEGLNYYMYRSRGSDYLDLAAGQKVIFEEEMMTAINELDNRNQMSPEAFELDLSHLG